MSKENQDSSSDADKIDGTFAVPKGDEALLLDHDYDGIRELDHPLPTWWRWLFYICIAFSVVYAGYYLPGFGLTLREELVVAMTTLESTKPKADDRATLSDAVVLAAFKSPDRLKLGQEVYISKCLACHGDKGQGLIGPNLTDDHWLHGTGSPADVAKVISEGVLDKGMPNWGAMLKTDEVINVTAFVRSLRGTQPPGAKEAQGEKHEFQNL